MLHKATVAEIVMSNPLAGDLFDILGIDYACHGELTLRDACAEAALDLLAVRRSLERLPKAAVRPAWGDAPVDELVHHLRDKAQPRIAQLLVQLTSVLADRCGPCADWPEDIGRLTSLTSKLSNDWQAHAESEEARLFPWVLHVETCWQSGRQPSIRLPEGAHEAVGSAFGEHAAVASTLRAMEATTLRLAARDPSCPRLQRAFRDLHHAVREHAHLCNNVVFPRAMMIADAVERPAEVTP